MRSIGGSFIGKIAGVAAIDFPGVESVDIAQFLTDKREGPGVTICTAAGPQRSSRPSVWVGITAPARYCLIAAGRGAVAMVPDVQ